MADQRVSLKNPVLAAVLAFLIPGAGHLYQGRLFKAILYAVCIVGMYSCGVAWAAGRVVYFSKEGPNPRTFKFIGQAGVGLPAVFAYVQHTRLKKPMNRPGNLQENISTEFTGRMDNHADPDLPSSGTIEGKLKIERVSTELGPSMEGTFEGDLVDDNGRRKPIEFRVGGGVNADKPVSGDKERGLRAQILGKGTGRSVGTIDGTIPRPWVNWFQVPLDRDQEQRAHRELGKFHELAEVFTIVAGLLNILAIGDAFRGPAYGYGDEPAEKPEEKKGEGEKKA